MLGSGRGWVSAVGVTGCSVVGVAWLPAVGVTGLSEVGGARRPKFRGGEHPILTPRGSVWRPRALPSGPADMSSGDAGSGGREGAPRAAATLCSLYHEAGQRLRRLQDQLASRDAVIERLRARLAALEGGTAPSLVDALLEQVARFREQLRQQEGGAVEAALRQVRGRAGGAGRGGPPLPRAAGAVSTCRS